MDISASYCYHASALLPCNCVVAVQVRCYRASAHYTVCPAVQGNAFRLLSSLSSFAVPIVQLVVRRPTISHFRPWIPNVSPNLQVRAVLVIDTVSPSLQSRSPVSTMASLLFRNHSRCSLDPIQNTSLMSIFSQWHDSGAISCHNRRMTLTSPFYTTLRRSSFRPFPRSGFPSILSNFSFALRSLSYIAQSSNNPRTLSMLSSTSDTSEDCPLIPSTSTETA